MSGYLQRLVQTAAQSVQSVHPFAGSVFASNHGDQTTGLESEEVVVAPSAINSAAFRPVGGLTSPQNISQGGARPEADANRTYRPNAPFKTSTALSFDGETNEIPVARKEFVQPGRPSSYTEEVETKHLLSRVTPTPEFHPLMSPEPFAAEPHRENASSGAKHHASGDNRSSVARELNSDDIQIHIGRIEVTAVHPPAPRTAKTPDRGPSLDAYLNRRAR